MSKQKNVETHTLVLAHKISQRCKYTHSNKQVPPSLAPDAVESNIVVTVTTKSDKEEMSRKDDEKKERKTEFLDRHYYVRVHNRPYVGQIQIDDDEVDSIETKMHVFVKVVSLCDMKTYQENMYITIDEKTCRDAVRDVADLLYSKLVHDSKKIRQKNRKKIKTEKRNSLQRMSSAMSTSSTPTSVDGTADRADREQSTITTATQIRDDVVTSRGKNRIKCKLDEDGKEIIEIPTSISSPRRIAKKRTYDGKRKKKKSSKARKAWKRAMKEKEEAEFRKQVRNEERVRTNQDIEKERKRLCEYTIERMNRVAGLHRTDKDSFYRFIGLHLPLEMRSEWYVALHR